MKTIIDIEFWRLLSAYLFVLLLLGIVKFRGLNREKRILVATARMTFQLILVGYILTYIFKNPHPFITLGIIAIMEAFAILNVFKQVDEKLSSQLKKVIAISMIFGTSVCLAYFSVVVIHFSPWYEPRYFIPTAGMIIGNSMTGITLGVKHLAEGMKSKRDLVEGALMLGATPEMASKSIVNEAFDSAILPTINSMVGMGIVFLPGMMTGQILSGVNPLTAIEYQIAIMLAITGSVSFSVILSLLFGYRTFFTNKGQLIE
jgi:putative ABC transport system permease protein